jgi:hypothetical protein
LLNEAEERHVAFRALVAAKPATQRRSAFY